VSKKKKTFPKHGKDFLYASGGSLFSKKLRKNFSLFEKLVALSDDD
jgi:hypothetical protein